MDYNGSVDAESEAFLAEIRTTGNSCTILAYADWLEDHQDGLCDVLRLCELRRVGGEVLDAMKLLNPSQQRWFAANCAERVTPVFHRFYPGNVNMQVVIDAVRQFVNGNCRPQDVIKAVDKMWDSVGSFIQEEEAPGTAADFAGQATAKQSRKAVRTQAYLAARWAASAVDEQTEIEWQASHATKIRYLGLIPLTEAERNEHA